MDAFLRLLQQPEYVHTLINPLPVYGVGVGLIALILALFLRNRAAHITAFAIIFVGAASAWPVVYYGDEAYDRVLSMADSDGSAWLKAHEHRADKLVWFFYALAIVSAAAIVVPIKFPKVATALTILTVVLAVGALGAGGYIAYAGGKIRHREFRNEPPPPNPPDRED
ncbi:MAG TPA: hypothetical protein VGH08_03340 [Chthoniobacterales bacterium]|jgi:hypothetical protein